LAETQIRRHDQLFQWYKMFGHRVISNVFRGLNGRPPFPKADTSYF